MIMIISCNHTIILTHDIAGFWAPKDESVHPPPPLKPAVPDEQYHEEPVDIPVEMARERQKRLRMLKTVYNRPVIPSIEINSVLDPVWRKWWKI